MSTTRPSRTAVRLVRIAARALPADGRRERYRDEFVAELYGLSTARQLRHAVGVVVLARSLRSALLSAPSPSLLEVAVAPVKAARPLLCRLNLRHKWRIDSSEDGGRFRHCVRCGKDWYRGGPDQGHWMAASGS
jgi:hypothetical protein